MILPDVPTRAGSGDAPYRLAVRQAQLGAFQAALDSLAQSDLAQDDADRVFLAGQLRRWMRPVAAPGATTLVWQVSPHCWEGDWIRFLTAPVADHDVFDGAWRVQADRMVVVDNTLDRAKEAYYRRLYEAGISVCLIHLSDEEFGDDLSSYRWCALVYRNYWSPLLEGYRHVHSFSLGYKIGFAADGAPPPVSERVYLWSFAGDPNKSTRQGMLSAMRAVAPHRIHLTDGFFAANNLSTADYRAMMRQSVFIPCPAGNVNLDSFRIYEALEAGCIPIVERRPGFDYFTRLLGPHPLPTLDAWSQAPAMVAALQAGEGLEALRMRCHGWWEEHKRVLRDRMGLDIRRA